MTPYHLIPKILRSRLAGPVRCAAIGAAVAASLVLAGCAASSDHDGGSGAPGQQLRPGTSTEQQVPELPRGKFTVQLGAFQSQEGAATVASVAKTRFSKEVYTILDDRDGLFKVMLGAFDTKDLARAFRDAIVTQYPQEYRDAWVSELAR
jgi:hypothetical protein